MLARFPNTPNSPSNAATVTFGNNQMLKKLVA
jgi:hypothetical protein